MYHVGVAMYHVGVLWCGKVLSFLTLENSRKKYFHIINSYYIMAMITKLEYFPCFNEFIINLVYPDFAIFFFLFKRQPNYDWHLLKLIKNTWAIGFQGWIREIKLRHLYICVFIKYFKSVCVVKLCFQA